MRLAPSLRTALLLATAILLPACGAGDAGAPRLVVLYAPCTVNRAALGPYAPELGFTPRLDAFAREAVVFDAHRTESGISGTSFASLFSGTQADRHGVFQHPHSLPDELHLIFEAFGDAGFETWYWGGHAMAGSKLGYAQGVPAEHLADIGLVGTDPRFVSLLERLRDDPDARALVVTSFSVTHTPWDLQHVRPFLKRHPEEAASLGHAELFDSLRLFERNAFQFQSDFRGAAQRLDLTTEDVERMAAALEVIYRSKVWLLDGLVGTVLDANAAHGLDAKSLVAFTADHGQQLYRSDRLFQWTHGPDLAPEVIDVPLLIRGDLPPDRIEAVTRSVDVYPTLAGLAGIQPLPPVVDGVDLAPALRGEAPLPELHAYSHGTLRRFKFFDPDTIDGIWAARSDGSRTYVSRKLQGRWDLATEDDDGVRRSVEPSDPEHATAAIELRRYREHMIAAYRRLSPTEATSKEEALELLEPDEAEALRALGYIE